MLPSSGGDATTWAAQRPYSQSSTAWSPAWPRRCRISTPHSRVRTDPISRFRIGTEMETCLIMQSIIYGKAEENVTSVTVTPQTTRSLSGCWRHQGSSQRYSLKWSKVCPSASYYTYVYIYSLFIYSLQIFFYSRPFLFQIWRTKKNSCRERKRR